MPGDMESNSMERQTRTISPFLLAEQEAFWLKTLYGDLPVLDTLLDHPRQLTQSFLRASETKSLDTLCSERIQQWCHQRNVSLYTFLLTALTIVIARHTAQKR